MRNRRKTVGDVGFHDPAAAPPGLINEYLQGRRAPSAPGATRSCTAKSLPRRPARARSSRQPARPGHGQRNRQRPLLAGARLRDEHPPGRQRPVPPLPQLRGQLAEQPGHPVLLSVRQADTVNASSAAVAAHILPRPVQHIPAADVVEQRMEPSARIGLGRPVKRMLQGSDSVPTDSRQGGPSRNTGTHQSAAPSTARERSSGPSLTAGCVALQLDQYYGRLRLPPGTPPISRLHTGYRTASSRASPQHAPAGEGLSSSRRHHLNVPRPLTPESPSRLHSRIFTASMAFAVSRPARHSLRCLTTRQASLPLRTVQLLPHKGFRRWAPARPVSRPNRQPATRLPGNYPDRTHTSRRRRASDQVMTAGRSPP